MRGEIAAGSPFMPFPAPADSERLVSKFYLVALLCLLPRLDAGLGNDILASTNTLDHSEKLRFVVMTTLVCSYSLDSR